VSGEGGEGGEVGTDIFLSRGGTGGVIREWLLVVLS
jgi:hypothetical protein